MSYTTELKRSLVEKEIKKKCCRRALLYGILASRGEVSGDTVSLSLESGVAAFFAKETGAKQQYSSKKRTNGTSHHPRTRLSLVSASAVEYMSKNGLFCPSFAKPCDHCMAHFMRGIFLSVGRMADYQKLYRLEFSAGDKTDALAELLTDTIGEPKRTRRRNEELLYYKTNAAICDFLAYIGAEATAFALINDYIEAGYRNAANRRANCEAHNIEKSVVASMQLVHLIRRLIDEEKFSRLPDELQETARLRVEHPSASLSAIGSWCTPPVSKSGNNHRLEKIERLAKECLAKSKGEGENG